MSFGLSKKSRTAGSNVTNLMDFGSSGRKTIQMTLAPEAAGHIMDRLTDLYTNPILATVREVTSNAMDATAELAATGVKVDPIEVEMPSRFSPEFVVRDYGVGMSPEVIEHVFATFGRSTKGDSFNQIGAYGLGAKAPLAYCNQFYLETTHDGITSKVAVSRLDSGPSTEILSSVKTGNKSGTTVTIPVKLSSIDSEIHQFRAAINTYKHLSFDVPIIIDGTLYFGNENYFQFGEMVIEATSGTKGRVWIRKNSITSFLKTSFSDQIERKWNYSYLLSGYLYKAPNTSNGLVTAYGVYGGIVEDEYSDVIIELKPGVVDFTSSRDEITSNERTTVLQNLVTNSLFGHNDFIVNSIVSAISNEAVDEHTATSILMAVRPVKKENKAVFTTCNGKNTEVAIKDFADSRRNLMRDIFKASDRSVFSMVFYNEKSKHRRCLSINSNESITPTLSPQKNGMSVTEVANHVVSSFMIDPEGVFSTSLLGASYTLQNINVDVNKIYVITEADNEKKIRRALRARTHLAQINGTSFHYIFVNRSVPAAERELFINSLVEENRDKVEWVGEKFFNEIIKSRRNSNGGTSTVSDNSISVNHKVITKNGFENYDQIVNRVVFEESAKFRKNDIREHFNKNGLFVVESGSYNNIYEVLNGYVHTYGFAALEGRPVFHIHDPLKKDTIALSKSSEEIIRGTKSPSHQSPEAERIIEGLPVYGRKTDGDLINRAADLQIFSSWVSRELSKEAIRLDSSRSNLTEILKNVEKLNTNFPAIEKTLRLLETIGENKKDALNGITLDDVTKRYGVAFEAEKNFNALKDVLKKLNGWYSNSLVIATEILKRKETPDYLKEASAKWLEESFEKVDFRINL